MIPINASHKSDTNIRRGIRLLAKQKYLYIMSLPFVVWIFIFKFAPIYGWLYAFQDYNPAFGIAGSKWVGLEHFIRFFTISESLTAIRNTLVLSSLNLILHNTLPIIFALLINEMQYKRFKKISQTVSYLPHFVSMVVVANIFLSLLNNNGPINDILLTLGILDEPKLFWTDGRLYWMFIPLINAWKETGWSAIIYLAAITSIDPELYEASTVDGCGRFKKIWHITIPGILPTVVVLWVLSVGGLLHASFEQAYLFGNPANRGYSAVIGSLTFKYGIEKGQFSFATAIGLMEVIIGFILVAVSNFIAKKFTEYSLW